MWFWFKKLGIGKPPPPQFFQKFHLKAPLIITNKSLTMAVIIMKLTEFADRIWGIEKPPNFTKLISFLLCRTHFGEVPQLIMAASTRLTCVDWFYLVKIIL